MAKSKGRDNAARQKGGKRNRKVRRRQVYIFAEGKVSEIEYIDLIMESGEWHRPDRRVDYHFENDTVESKYRKPLPMVRDAVFVLRRVEREAKAAGLDKDEDWNWPQVWILFDRDEHQGIAEARKLAEQAGVRVAYSHPCFELWRLLHYQNYTSTFGGVCGSANSRLRSQPGFAKTYGKNVRTVSEQQSKHVKPDQVLRGDRYSTAKKYAQKINNGHSGPDPNTWDPYTDVWRFVEDGLLLSGY